jgi:tetratricopeptide (TPR) repeat protein
MVRFFATFLTIFCATFLLFGLVGMTQGHALITIFLLCVLFALGGSLGVFFLAERLAELLGRLVAFIKGTNEGHFEQLYVEVGRAHDKKGHRQYADALAIVDRVLEKSPNFPEALFLKAQILWEKHRDSKAAEVYLRKVLQVVPQGDALYRLAVTYQDEINGLKKLGGTNVRSIEE